VRLEPDEIVAIREEVRRRDADAEIFLYGSRTDDTAHGGDIDLLIVSDRIVFRDLLRIRCAIQDRIGWQQLDVVVRRRNELGEPLAAAGIASGIKL
jgi:predicted nucleotidyltransferase